jgi:hypothetical protein
MRRRDMERVGTIVSGVTLIITMDSVSSCLKSISVGSVGWVMLP